MDVEEALEEAVFSLIRSGHSNTPQMDAELLLAHAKKCSVTHLLTWPNAQLSHDEATVFRQLLSRREKKEPVALILGHQDFWSMTLKVNEHTLVPRPDTECLVEWVIHQPLETAVVCDAGTGTGAIALAVAGERPNWQVLAIEKSTEALAVACDNQKNLKLPVSLFQGDWLAAVGENTLDILVSNPPYIPPNDKHLADLTFEPRSALVAKKQGLSDNEILVEQANVCLKASGVLAIEHGFDQGYAVQEIFNNAGFIDIETHQDYGKNDRFTVGKLDKNP